jgi:TetR/AcrR family transcriptional regulator
MRERDPEKSRQRILAAAEREFAEKGYYGARVDVIAENAQINKRMIYAYFQDKEGLYKQVLFQVYGRMEAVEQDLITCKYTGKKLIYEIISAYFSFLKENPTFVSILMWENLNKGQYLKELENSRIERGTIRYFVEMLEAGRKDGTYRNDINPWHTALSLITTCFANFSNQYTLSKLFHNDLASEQMIEQRRLHTINLMIAYLCPDNKEEEK